MPDKVKPSLSKRELIKIISDRTDLKPAIVKDVIDCFSDVFVEEVVTKGHFQLANCFTVETKTRKARQQYNVSKGVYEEFPEMNILSIKLSRKINSFHRWKHRNQYNAENGLTKEDWANRTSPELPKPKS